MAKPKNPPLVTFEDVISAFAVAVARAGLTLEDTVDWPPIIFQTRISRTNDHGSTSSPRQIANQAEWCVDNRFRPVNLIHEEVSGSVYRRRPRRVFAQAFDDLQHDRIRDPATGKPVGDIACFHYDRFTRDPEEGGDWLRMLRTKQINLHETYYREAPKPLHQVEHEIREAWNRGSKEVERLRERIMDALVTKARRGEPTYGLSRMYGHESVVDGETGKVIGFRAVPDQAAVIRALIEHVVDRGGNAHSATRWLNDNGHMTVGGKTWHYNNVHRLLSTPRIAGLVRLRSDRTRLHEDGYEGELYPQELLVPDGEGPPVGFVPPIEPIVSYARWLRVQAALEARRVQHEPRGEYFATGLVDCATCGQTVIGGRTVAGANYRCPKNHLHGHTRRRGAEPTHPTMRSAYVDRVLEEIIFAAIDGSADAAAAVGAEEDDLIAGRKEKHRRAIESLDERLGNISYMLARSTISRSQYDGYADEIQTERADHRHRLAELDSARPEKTLPEDVVLRDLWPTLTMAERREWFSVVFERVVLHRADPPGSRSVTSRLEFVFRSGYMPPADELAELLAAVDRELRAGQVTNRTSPELLDRVIDLSGQGYGLVEIAETMRAEGIVGPWGRTSWSNSDVSRLLRRARRERGFTYPRRVDRSRISLETRQLIVALADKLPSYAAVARELNLLAVPRPNGNPWNGSGVANALRVWEQRMAEPRPLSPYGIVRVRPQKHLPDALREKIWRMHRRDGLSLAQVAKWLESTGIRTARGRARWDRATLLYLIRSVDRDHEADGSSADAA